MTPEQYRRAKELFAEAVELSADERGAWLARHAADDTAVRNEVAEMLAEESDPRGAGARLDGGAAGLIVTDGLPPAGVLPERIGNYRIAAVKGHGGMGVVYEAEQDSPRRRVALKVIRSSMLSPRMLARFRREAEVLGQLQHPGIAHIYEASTTPTESGRQPFFAMEFIDGEPIHEYAERNELNVRERLELVARVCDAVQHAHQKGVIHRDLKPSNILVAAPETRCGGTGGAGQSTASATDAIGQPKILDFGIARVTDGDIQAATQHTDAGQIIGTLAYMSPEQAAGLSGDIDTRSDVYSIGVVLFELLTGRLPLEITGVPVAEAARIIRDEEAVRAGSIDVSLRGDLDTIIAKATEKDRERRYESAAAMAQDIRRYLCNEPIGARPASTFYQVRKFARRNRGLVAGLALTLLVLLLGAAGTALGWASALRANRELAGTNRRLERTNRDLQKVSEFQSAQLTDIDVALMGLGMRDDLVNAVSPEGQSDFQSHLDQVNFVDIARATLDRSLFARAIEAIDAQFADQPALHAALLQDLATTMRELGLLDSALAPQQRALEIRRDEVGDENPDTLASLHEYGILDLKRGDFESAEARLREAWAANRRLAGGDAPRTLSVAGSLATVLQRQGRHEDAEKLARAALEGLRGQAGSDDPETLQAMATLAHVLNFRGRYDEAESLFRDALRHRREVLGDEHPSTVSTMSNLAVVLENQGRFDEAISLAREAFTIRARLLGTDHPDTLGSQMEVGARLTRQGKLAEAEPILREVLDKRRRMLGRDHYDTVTSVDALASLLEERGRFAEAEALFRESLECRRRTLGEDHPAALRALGNLGFILNRQGKSAEAEPIYRETLAGLRRVYGNDHPHTLTSIGNLAALLSGLGKDDEAQPLQQESLEGRRRLLGNDHPSTLNALYNMGDMLLRKDRIEEAEPYCREALEGYQRVGGDDHIGTLYSLTLMGRLRLAQQRPEEAEPFFHKAVERRRRVNGDDHPQTLEAVLGLADTLEAQDHWADAEPWRRFALDANVRNHPDDPIRHAGAWEALGRNLLRQDNPERAEAALAESLSLYRASDLADDWTRWNAQSLLAEAVAADPGRYAQAETLLVEAENHMTPLARAAGESKMNRVSEIRSIIAALHGAWQPQTTAEERRSEPDTPDSR